ncbi:DNA-processing protein DprA [Helicobacter bilis]|uniref:DNA processing protein DprA n=1 Tax=Helicobacter bilis TaxID=37372 RepID=A0A4V6I5Q2_9HELI|nr:DNA-processing protein DprA [Helicobacter bilis]TLE08792.1 DNA processing protein DprA [Helicobacter bilis]
MHTIITQSEFLESSALAKYLSMDKIALLDDLIHKAKENNLKSKHLYKAFNAVFARGNLSLLKKPKVAIIGTRSPNQYAKQMTTQLANTLSQKGFVIVSGGAIGIDSIAHLNANNNAILILPCGIDAIYPKENATLINNLAQNGLVLSEYSGTYKPMKHTFLERNRLIIAWSDIIIIPQADIKSGSSSSANLAITLQKPLFVLPHRLHESRGTQELLHAQKAQCIYDIESFVTNLCEIHNIAHTQEIKDPLLEFAYNNGLFEDALKLFGDLVFAYELEGKIKRNGLYIVPC